MTRLKLVNRFFSQLVKNISEILHSPTKVLAICLVVAFTNLVFDGTLIQIWRLNRNIEQFEQKTHQVEKDIHLVKSKLELANDPQYIERQARDRFDLVEEGDLVFVFSEEDEESL